MKIYEEIVDHFTDVRAFPVTFDDTLATIQLLNSFYLSDEKQGWADVSTAETVPALAKGMTRWPTYTTLPPAGT